MVTMKNGSLLYERLTALASKIHEGEVSPWDLVNALLERIEETEDKIKAYVTVTGEEARRAAGKAEKEIQRGQYRGLLHGIPVSLKDLIDTKGVKTTYGSRIFRENFPNEDATVVKKLKEAGAIILGKTNTHEFALGAITPPTRNPWSLDRIPGGSSGGSAAAIAAGSALTTLGTDTGGSIRIPSSYCGVVGLKPTYGLVSRASVFPVSWSLDHVGPITRYVEDTAVMLQFIAGYDEKDPATRKRKIPDYVAELQDSVDGLRAGVPRNYFFEHVDHEVLSAVRQAIKVLERSGMSILELTVPAIDGIMGAYTALEPAEAAANHRRIYAEHAHEYMYETKLSIEAGFFVSATQYIDILRARPKWTAQVLEAMKDVDVMLTPSQPIVAPKTGVECWSEVFMEGYKEEYERAVVRFTAPFNLTGLPALSICCGFNSDNLPIGLQIIGKPFQESTVLRVGHYYEQATGRHRWLAQVPL